MIIKLYQQRFKPGLTYSSKKLPMPIGEDAIPFIGKNLLFTADGLGGDGGYPHTLLKKELFEKELFFKTLYGDMYDEALLPQYLKDYIDETFSYIFQVGYDEYKSDVHKMKTSGFFASRVLSIMFLCEVYFNPEFNVDKMFEEAENDLRAFEIKYSKKFESVIKEKMTKAASNGNFVLEGKIQNIPILPTTLSAVFYKEVEGYVKTIAVWAGDSRVYAFNLRDDDHGTGLSQITEDDEVDEVMNNRISVNQNYWINCKYKEIPKPCILFGSSDGCFDTVTSRLDFEWILLDAFNTANSTKDYHNNLKELFKAYSPDDSATLAWKSFGFKEGFVEKCEDDIVSEKEIVEKVEVSLDNQEENVEIIHEELPKEEVMEDDFSIIKNNALIRIKNITDKYLSQMPTIFEVDYNNEYAKINELYRAKLKDVKKLIDGTPRVKDEIISYISTNKQSEIECPTNDEEVKEEYAANVQNLYNEILAYVKEHWIKFRKKEVRFTAFGSASKTSQRLEDIESQIELVNEKKATYLQTNIRKTEELSRFVNDALVKIDEGKYDEITFPSSDLSNFSYEIYKYVQRASSKKDTEFTIRLKELLSEKQTLINKLTLEEEALCKEVAHKICNKEFEPTTEFQTEYIASINAKLNELIEVSRAKIEENKGRKLKAILRYYDKNYAKIIEENRALIIGDDAISAKYRECKNIIEGGSDILAMCNKRDQIYADYDITYCTYFRREE